MQTNIKKTITATKSAHIGKKIEKIRRIQGVTQADLGQQLGITKQAVSKMEQSEKINNKRLNQVAEALGVSAKVIKDFNEKVILDCNNIFLNEKTEKSSIDNVTIDNVTIHIKNEKKCAMIKTIRLFEELIKIERETFQIATERMSSE